MKRLKENIKRKPGSALGFQDEAALRPTHNYLARYLWFTRASIARPYQPAVEEGKKKSWSGFFFQASRSAVTVTSHPGTSKGLYAADVVCEFIRRAWTSGRMPERVTISFFTILGVPGRK